MVYLSAAVVKDSHTRPLLPWQIVECHSACVSIRAFFEAALLPKLNLEESETIELSEVYFGSARDRLFDRADPDLPLSPLVEQFGKFMKIVVAVSDHVIEMNQPQRSVVDVMRQAQRSHALPSLPSKVPEKNNKDKLFNVLVDDLQRQSLFWRADEVDSFGVNFVKSLSDVLWYIDGHQDTFNDRSYPIPGRFAGFQGFNIPERSKHRKRSISNLSADILEALASKLFRLLQSSYFHRQRWGSMKESCEKLAHSLHKYTDELKGKNKVMKLVHSSTVPWRSLQKGLDIFYLKPTKSLPLELREINSIIDEAGPYSMVDLLPYLPSNSKHRYTLTCKLKEGLAIPAALMVYSVGNNAGNSYFAWHVPDSSFDEALSNSQQIIEEVKQSLPVYHTRAMKSEFIHKFGRITSAVQPAVLRYFYKDLTGDCSGSETLSQSEIDIRVKEAIEMEDTDIVMDLRHLNSGRKGQYDAFWEACEKFLQEVVGTAVDDRRHTSVTHVATAISIRDFRDQVAKKCPDGTRIPSIEWIRLQFWPKLPHSKRALHHTGRFKIRFKVQQRQFRKEHPDSHYAACIFRYQREYAVTLKAHAMLDDKHRIKVGEPTFPVAAAERGRRVLTAAGSSFLVGDHDFTKFSLIPSDVPIPDDVSESWYSGQVYVGLKEGAFQPSSPLRHVSELCPLIEAQAASRPVLFLYSDGGPDHRLTYLSVQLSLIALYLYLDLDYLCAARTAPFHSWRNPVERVMSIVNLGLQCVGLARSEMDEENERIASKASSMKECRKLAIKHTGFKEALLDSVASPKITLSQVLSRLQLKGKDFKLFTPATDEEMDKCWSSIKELDPCITLSVTKATISDHPAVQRFIDHCCRKRHYSFEIRKCGMPDCYVCKAPRLGEDVFQQLHYLPDPTPGSDNHYLPFGEVFGKPTSEEHRPSLHLKRTKKSLPFTASLQHVKNVDMMLLCEDCEIWRLLYCKKKLKKEERRRLGSILDDYSYTCGSSLQDLDMPSPLNNVYVRSIRCFDPVEKLYYSAGYDPICIYCAGNVEQYNESTSYPQCIHCSSKPKIIKQ